MLTDFLNYLQIKAHYGINSLDNSPDNDYLKQKFTNSFGRNIFLFLSNKY